MRSIRSFAHLALTAAVAAGALLTAITLSAAPVQAQALTFSGSLTAASPTFNRPLTGTPPTSLSGVGTSVYYFAQPFYVSTTGSYDLLNASTYDNFMVLYQNSFVPTSPLVNAIMASDDVFGTNSGSTGIALNAGTQYYFVSTSFSNGVTGSFNGSVGTVTRPGGSLVSAGLIGAAVPEPGTLALVLPALALPLVGIIRRRKAA